MTVFERPGLKEFFKQIGEFADLILFTAGIEGRCCSVRLIDLHGYSALFFSFYLLCLGFIQVTPVHSLTG